MKELICIVCPKGCRLSVDEENGYAVSGNDCPRGEAYGKAEAQHPTRVLTSTVRIEGAPHRRLPVRTDGAIPKDRIRDAMALLDDVLASAPVRMGDVILADLFGSGISFIATRDMPRL